eukprot:gene17072-biopygen23318
MQYTRYCSHPPRSPRGGEKNGRGGIELRKAGGWRLRGGHDEERRPDADSAGRRRSGAAGRGARAAANAESDRGGAAAFGTSSPAAGTAKSWRRPVPGTPKRIEATGKCKIKANADGTDM